MHRSFAVRLRAVLLVLLLLALGAAPSRAQDAPGLRARLDSIVRRAMAERPVAGMSVAVTVGADTVLLEGYGHAELEHGVPASPATVYQIASLTKQFTAAAVLRLVDRGEIALDDRIDEHVPALASLRRPVTIRQLLAHTSGLASDLGDGREDLVTRPFADRDSVAAAYLQLVVEAGFDAEPGTEYAYSNHGYALLGTLIESVTGRTYGEHLREAFFEPLGMTRTSACPRESIVEGRARGYDQENGRLVNAPFVHQRVRFSAGSLCSTVEDLLTWNEALHGGRLLSEALYEAMTTPGPSGTYGFGIGIVEVEGHPYFDHGGWVSGFTARLDYFPGERMSVVVLSNTAPRSGVHEVGRAIAREVLGLGPAPPMSHDH